MNKVDLLETVSCGQPGVVFAYGMRRTEIFSLIDPVFPKVVPYEIVKINLGDSFSELVNELERFVFSDLNLDLCKEHYNYARNGSPEAFYYAIIELCEKFIEEKKNLVLFIDIPENVFQKSLESFEQGEDDREFSFAMNFLTYITRFYSHNFSAFVSIQSLYLAMLLSENKINGFRVNSVVFL